MYFEKCHERTLFSWEHITSVPGSSVMRGDLSFLIHLSLQMILEHLWYALSWTAFVHDTFQSACHGKNAAKVVHSSYRGAKAPPYYWQTNPRTWSFCFPVPGSMRTQLLYLCVFCHSLHIHWKFVDICSDLWVNVWQILSNAINRWYLQKSEFGGVAEDVLHP